MIVLTPEDAERAKIKLRAEIKAATTHEEAAAMLLECRIAIYELLNGSGIPSPQVILQFGRLATALDDVWRRILKIRDATKTAPAREEMQ